MTLDGALYRAPIAGKSKSVLDVGTGSGIWALDFAKQHPSCNVLGIDLSAVKSNSAIPPNCSFGVKDVETEWNFEDVGPFDLIHSRMLVQGMHGWRGYFSRCFKNLKPGGWLEVHELQCPMYSANSTVSADVPFLRWSHLLTEGLAKGGIDGGAANEFSDYLKDLGFGSVAEEKFLWALGAWMKDEKGRRISEMHLENFHSGLEGITTGVFTRNLGWTQEQVNGFVEEIHKDIDDPEKKYYFIV